MWKCVEYLEILQALFRNSENCIGTTIIAEWLSVSARVQRKLVLVAFRVIIKATRVFGGKEGGTDTEME